MRWVPANALAHSPLAPQTPQKLRAISPDVAAIADDALVAFLDKHEPVAGSYLRGRCVAHVKTLLREWVHVNSGVHPMLAMFGSAAMGVADSFSDVDILVGVPFGRNPLPLLHPAQFFGDFPRFLRTRVPATDLRNIGVAQGRVPLVTFSLQGIKFDLLFAIFPVHALPLSSTASSGGVGGGSANGTGVGVGVGVGVGGGGGGGGGGGDIPSSFSSFSTPSPPPVACFAPGELATVLESTAEDIRQGRVPLLPEGTGLATAPLGAGDPIPVDFVSALGICAAASTMCFLRVSADTPVFKLCLRAARLWAHRRCIFSSKMGYFNGIMLACMVARALTELKRAFQGSGTKTTADPAVPSRRPMPPPHMVVPGADAPPFPGFLPPFPGPAHQPLHPGMGAIPPRSTMESGYAHGQPHSSVSVASGLLHPPAATAAAAGLPFGTTATAAAQLPPPSMQHLHLSMGGVRPPVAGAGVQPHASLARPYDPVFVSGPPPLPPSLPSLWDTDAGQVSPSLLVATLFTTFGDWYWRDPLDLTTSPAAVRGMCLCVVVRFVFCAISQLTFGGHCTTWCAQDPHSYRSGGAAFPRASMRIFPPHSLPGENAAHNVR